MIILLLLCYYAIMCVYRFYYMQFGNEPSAIRDAMVVGVSNSNFCNRFWPKLCFASTNLLIYCMCKGRSQNGYATWEAQEIVCFLREPVTKRPKKKDWDASYQNVRST